MFTSNIFELAPGIAKEKTHSLLQASQIRRLLNDSNNNRPSWSEKITRGVSWLQQVMVRSGLLANVSNKQIAAASGGKS